MVICPRCQRVNPKEAAFCYFDGVELRHANGTHPARSQRLPNEFVFPSGRRCSTYDELLQGCLSDWPTARDLLRQGVFHSFLSGGGRTDLALAAQNASAQPDTDLALDAFLARLPGQVEAKPRLDLIPRRLHIDTLHSGERRQFKLTVVNQGKGLLHGTVAIEEGHAWIQFAEESKDGKCVIKTLDRQEVTLSIDTHGLPAPNKYAAKLTVLTNGGVAEVPVRLELVARPFGREPFSGASTPREMAENMRAQPKAGAPLLESGEVARWFASNGWSYPVTELTAEGVAAVQQFFEGMGLSKPPPLSIAENPIELACLAGETLDGRLQLKTPARKWIYARAESNVPWLHMADGSWSGPQQAWLPFDIDTLGLLADRTHEATIRVFANGGQALTARVLVRVGQPPEPVLRRFLRPIMACAILGLAARLLLALPADLYARTWAQPGGATVVGGFDRWVRPEFGNPEIIRHFVLATCWWGAILGAWALWRRQRRIRDLLHGVVAGIAGGLAATATLACLLPQLDGGARFAYRWLGERTGWASSGGAGWVWCVLWILIVSLSWGLVGGSVGLLLSCMGKPGRRLASAPAAKLELWFRRIGLRSAASLFSVQ